MTNGALLIFSRAPIAGETKTRLIPLLGAQGAADFHQTILQSTLAKAKTSSFETVEIWCDTESQHPFLRQCSQDYSCAMKTQLGNDLGERMHHAMETTLVENAFVALIGSDCPTMTIDILNQTGDHLSNGKDAVLGPSKDGGYYLVGLKKPNSEIFQGIRWGGADVAEKTRQKFISQGLDFVELEELTDIDTPDDYQNYIEGF